MKLAFLLLTFSLSSFANTNFLTLDQADKVNSYLDRICPDTYCGGDINFFPQGINCEGDSCTVKFLGYGSSFFNEQYIQKVIGKKIVSSEYPNANIIIHSANVVMAQDNFEKMKITFNCQIGKLPMGQLSYSQKEDIVYDMVVFGCIDQLEKTVYDY